ncbi:hypothetical protein F4777DRAFT_168467 [Nemania sp. FL0916]|nr:hypothetical protein F4777DRAFT_168467 [Nemania sp. FL0916]
MITGFYPSPSNLEHLVKVGRSSSRQSSIPESRPVTMPAASKSANVDLTKNEKTVLVLAFQCFKHEPDIDWDKVAALGGYTNPRSAQNLMYSIKKKIAAVKNTGDQGVASPQTPVKKRAGTTPRSHKRKAAMTQEDTANESPTAKKVKPDTAADESPAAETVEQENSSDESPLAKKVKKEQ